MSDSLESGSTQQSMGDWKGFLESCPPGRPMKVQNVGLRKGTNFEWTFAMPDLELYCENPSCQGVRFFEGEADTNPIRPLDGAETYVRYRCRNCRSTLKVYSVRVRRDDSTGTPTSIGANALKIGEYPPFGPHMPARVISLIGPDRDLFLKGRRAEAQGMGVGAFAYYRRVVENQKNRLLDEIIRVSQRTGAATEIILLFEQAKSETQFSKAVDLVKDAVPQVLRIDTHNPLTLLHSALSEGLHAQTDEECLDLATSIRVVLTDLADRLGQALKDHEELRNAVSRLLERSTKPAKTANGDG